MSRNFNAPTCTEDGAQVSTYSFVVAGKTIRARIARRPDGTKVCELQDSAVARLLRAPKPDDGDGWITADQMADKYGWRLEQVAAMIALSLTVQPIHALGANMGSSLVHLRHHFSRLFFAALLDEDLRDEVDWL